MKGTNKDEFFIGWMDKTPAAQARFSRRIVWICLVLAISTALLSVSLQSGYESSSFEYGALSELTGVLEKEPVPMLKVTHGTDLTGTQVVQSILLVGLGKHGAEATIADMEGAQGHDLQHRQITLRGTRIFYDGKSAFELTEGADAYISSTQIPSPYVSRRQSLGQLRLLGEILDPKCAFGVMKPGHGKVHRSCATRCVAGGIPPVIRTQGATDTKYCLVLGEDGQTINTAILPYMGQLVQACGRAERVDDWTYLYLTPDRDLVRLGSDWEADPLPLCHGL